MAKTDKAKAGPRSRKTTKPAGRAPAPAKARKPRRSGSAGSGLDSLAKLAEHPIVAELISVAAIAAVAAIADHNVKSRTGEGQKGSSKAIKAAGKAAAAAIGKRLVNEFEEIQKASKTKKQRG